MLSGFCTMGRTLPQGHCHFFVGMSRLRQPAAMLSLTHPNPLPNGRTMCVQDAQVWTAPPGAPAWALRHKKKKSVLPKQGISGLPHNCSGSSKLPSLGRVTLFNEPSTVTSNATITRGRLAMRHAVFQPQQRSPKTPHQTGKIFNFGCFFFKPRHLSPTSAGLKIWSPNLKFRLPGLFFSCTPPACTTITKGDNLCR